MTDNFDAKVGLIGELFSHQASDAQKIRALQREYDDAFRVIAMLIAKFGTPDPLFPEKRVVRLSYDDMLTSPTEMMRWDEPENGEMCLGVKIDEQ